MSYEKCRVHANLLLSVMLLGTVNVTQVNAEDRIAQSASIEEVVVQARRQSESLQEVPISMTAFTGDAFEDAGLAEFSDISQMTPNFQIAPSGATGATFANMTIRAQTAGFLTLNADQAVGIYVNGAPITRGTGLFSNMFDIERIEVLRGPQGTLYGMNTTGGAVTVVTKAPVMNELSGYVEAEAGDYDRTDIEAVVNVPLIEDTLAARFGVSRNKRDGFGEGAVTGRELADDNEVTYRASLLFEPNDRVAIRMNADYHDVDENGSIFRSLTTVLGGFVTQESTDPDLYVGLELGTVPQFAKSEETNVNVTATIEFENFTLESITSYREQEASLQHQHSPITDVALGQDSDLFAQELRLAGAAISDRLDWQVGLFYSDESGQDQDFLPLLGQLELTEADNESLAVFAQGTYALTDNLSGTVGVRYTDVQRQVKDLEAGAPIFKATADFDAVSWLISLDYKITDDVMTYLSIARGFRSGGIDQGSLNSVVDPEYVVNYETGIKADALDGRLRVNTAIYYSDYEDIQRTAFDPASPVPVTVLRNAASATIYGFELETTARPIDGLLLSAGVGYTNASYDEFLDVDGLGNVLDREDDPFGGPEWQFNLSTRYETYLNGGMLLGFQANYFWQDVDDRSTDRLLTSLSRSKARINSYGLVNAQIDLDLGEASGWYFALFGTNLADKEYFTGSIIAQIGSLGTVSNRLVGNPRTWGVRIRKEF